MANEKATKAERKAGPLSMEEVTPELRIYDRADRSDQSDLEWGTRACSTQRFRKRGDDVVHGLGANGEP